MKKTVLEHKYNDEVVIKDMYNEIASIIAQNKEKMVYQINNTLVNTNFMIGKIIGKIKEWLKDKLLSSLYVIGVTCKLDFL